MTHYFFYLLLSTFALEFQREQGTALPEGFIKAKKETGAVPSFWKASTHKTQIKMFTESSANYKQLAEYLADVVTLNQKEVLTSDEVAQYMGVSRSYLYKLTMRQQIPHYKPLGKLCYFNRKEIEAWLQTNKVATEEELNSKAQTYCMRKGGEV